MNEDIYSRWLNLEEICKYLGISRDTAKKWIRTADMPAHRIGRLWKFRAEEVDEWVKAEGASSKTDLDNSSNSEK